MKRLIVVLLVSTLFQSIAFANGACASLKPNGFVPNITNCSNIIGDNNSIDSAVIYFKCGVVFDDVGRPVEALSVYTKAIKIYPKFAMAYFNRGLANVKMGNVSQAIDDYSKSIEINPNYKVSIDADITKQDGFRDSTLLSFLARRLPVQKKKKLLFKVTHSVPSPYQIKWKVRNFGEEAKGLDALRGEIHDDEGRETRQESTLYYGEHYVECYIIKDGKCVALGRILVPIGNNY